MKLLSTLSLAVCALSFSIALPNTYGQRARGKSPASAVTSLLPAGKTIETATDDELKAAVSAAIRKNPANAVEIAAAAVSAGKLSQATTIADAIGQLFAKNPTVTEQAPAIATAIAKAIYSKPEPAPQRATEVGSALSALGYHFAPHDPTNRDKIISLAVAGISATPEIDYSVKVYETFTQSLAALGASSELLSSVQTQSAASIADRAVSEQILATLTTTEPPKVPTNSNPNVVALETKVDNR